MELTLFADADGLELAVGDTLDGEFTVEEADGDVAIFRFKRLVDDE